ncbi:MAG: hypothetical protein RIC29_17400 [Rhodospirillaceae bacterium]
MNRLTPFKLFLALTVWILPAQAETTAQLIQRIEDAQSRGAAYMLRPSEITQLESSSDPVAHYYLGLVYAEGDTPNTPRDQCKAAEHIFQSAKAGYPYAQLYLAHASIWGIGIEHDLENAFAWATQAQKILIKTNLENETEPHQPYNFHDAKTVLDSALKCSLAIRTAVGIETEVTPTIPRQPVAAVPCLSDNKIVFEQNRIPTLLDIAETRAGQDSIKRNLLNCAPLNAAKTN